ncbi:MAG: M48 family metalloprotease [Niabella sp.]
MFLNSGMNYLPRTLFVALLAIGSLFFYLELLGLMGIKTSPATWAALAAVWLGICFSGYGWRGRLLLATCRVRRTALEEEAWMEPILRDLRLSSDLPITVELLILEEPESQAFALGHHTIVLSRGLIEALNKEEIQAVLAHEYGHLKDKDTQLATAYCLAGYPLRLLYRFFRGLIIAGRWRLSRWLLIALAAVMAFYSQGRVLLAVFGTFIVSFPLVQRGIEVLWCYFSRCCEFRQDAFAQSLGYGMALKAALLKIGGSGSDSVVSRYFELGSTHPMLYRRVRRLEWLDGLRPTC